MELEATASVVQIPVRRSANVERYRIVNDAWPKVIPPLTDKAIAQRAAKSLWRVATGKPWSARGGPLYKIRFVTGRTYTGFNGRVLEINLSPNERFGANHAWHHLVHTISHKAFWLKHGSKFRGHSMGHASYERNLVEHVVKSGWLDAELVKKLVKQVEPKPAVNPAQDKHQKVLARIVSWEKKAKRASNALKKLGRQKKYYERKLAA